MDDWWSVMDEDVCRELRDNGPMSPAEIGQRLGVSEVAVISLVALLAREGKVRICLVAGAEDAGRRQPDQAA
jgi:DNA-binding Lrp family transcriptional regulator